MLDVGWSELLVIAIVMIVVVGPKDLPKMLRAFGKATARMRSTANEFRNQFNEALKEAELEDVKNIIDETRKLDPRSKLTQVFDPIRSAGEDLKASMQSTTSMSPATPEKIAAVTTPVDVSGAPVPAPVPEQAAQEETAAPAVKKPRKVRAKAKPETAGVKTEEPAKTPAKTPVRKTAGTKAKPAAAKPTAAKPASKTAAAAKKPVNEKTSVNKTTPTNKKTITKTGIKA